MDNKRHRDAVDDEPASASGKRVRLDDVASAALAGSSSSSSSMQAVAHEALAMTIGAGFTAINKAPRPPAAASPPHRRNSSSSHANALSNHYTSGSRLPEPANRVVSNPAAHPSRNGNNSAAAPATAADDSTGSLDTISDITRRFRSAVMNGWSRRSPTYNTIDVLLLSWEDDESELKTSVSNIEAAFHNSLNYPTEVYTIRSTESSYDDIRAKVSHFFSRDQSLDRLAIFYYAGQCVSSNTPDGQSLFLVPRNHKAESSFPFSLIQAAYESTGCDVVLLMDHSDAVPFLTLGPRSNRRNVVELIVAPTPDPELGLMSFTKALAIELSNASTDEPLKIESLHATISHRMSISKPRGRGRPPKEPQARPPVDQQYLPKHQIFFHRRSVVLSPLPKEPQVIICLRVLSGSTDVNEWGKWIFNASPKARNSVQIEGMYTGFSTMIVLRVPVAEWHSFSECPIGSFVGYTTVGDISPKLQNRIDDELSAKLWADDAMPSPSSPPPPPPMSSSVLQHKSYPTGSGETPTASGHGTGPIARAPDGETTDANGQRKQRKALPTERKLLPSGASASSPAGPRKDIAGYPSSQIERPQFRPTQQHLQQYLDTVHLQSRQTTEKDLSANDAQLADAAQKPVKISIKLAGQSHMCKECSAGFKDADTLYNHVRKQHTRPFHCVFNWAGCESTFASKNEWKRHVMSQHILLHYWVCQVDQCCKIVNKAPGAAHSKFSLPNGAIFNRKDLYTQHLRRMHTPPHVKKLMKQLKAAVKPPSHPAISDWESRLKELQEGGIRPRCRLPDFMRCPVLSCASEFHGNNAWDERMEHVARHLEAAAATREPPVVFGGAPDPTLTDWATRYEVGIAKRVGPNTWHLDNPLRPEIMEWTGDANAGLPASLDQSMEIDEAQGHYRASTESYQQQYHHRPPHQNQHQHRNQHQNQHQNQHHFQIPQQHHHQQLPPQHQAQYGQIQHQTHPEPERHEQLQHQHPPQYQDQRPEYVEEPERRREQGGEEPTLAGEQAEEDAQPETWEAREQIAKETSSREPSQAVTQIQGATQEHSEAQFEAPSEAHSKAPSEVPVEVPSEGLVDSPVYDTTDATTPKSVTVIEPSANKEPARGSNNNDDDDDEKPNEDEITVATSSPPRD